MTLFIGLVIGFFFGCFFMIVYNLKPKGVDESIPLEAFTEDYARDNHHSFVVWTEIERIE